MLGIEKEDKENDYYTEERIKEIKEKVGEILEEDVSDKDFLEITELIAKRWDELGKKGKLDNKNKRDKSKNIHYKINGERKRDNKYF